MLNRLLGWVVGRARKLMGLGSEPQRFADAVESGTCARHAPDCR